MSSLPIKNLLNQSVFVVSYSVTSNEFGDEFFLTPIEYPARIEYQRRIGHGVDGTTYSSVATIYLEHDVHDNSRFFVPKYQDMPAVVDNSLNEPSPYITPTTDEYGHIRYDGRYNVLPAPISRDNTVLKGKYQVDEIKPSTEYDGGRFDIQARNGIWYTLEEIKNNAKPALSINHFYDRIGNFSHCEVTI